MKNVIAAVDFSAVTEGVVAKAFQVAKTFGGRLWIVHVAAPDPDFVGYEVGPKVVRTQVATKLRDEHQKLEDLARRFQDRAVESTALLIQGPTAQTLLAKADELGADLLVLGSHGHGALHNLLVGSVAESVLKATRIPVLVVPARR
jgi:nucleotide-binding universal stress UspA family protein